MQSERHQLQDVTIFWQEYGTADTIQTKREEIIVLMGFCLCLKMYTQKIRPKYLIFAKTTVFGYEVSLVNAAFPVIGPMHIL